MAASYFTKHSSGPGTASVSTRSTLCAYEAELLPRRLGRGPPGKRTPRCNPQSTWDPMQGVKLASAASRACAVAKVLVFVCTHRA